MSDEMPTSSKGNPGVSSYDCVGETDQAQDVAPLEGVISPAEGVASQAEGVASPLEGVASQAEGVASQAEGVASQAEGVASQAEGVTSPPDPVNTGNSAWVAPIDVLQFRDNIRRTLENMEPNIHLQIGNVVIECRRSILQLYSRYIREMIPEPDYIVLPKEKVSVHAMTVIIDWMYDPKYKFQRKDILAVYIAANFLEIEYLSAQCWEYIVAPKNREDLAFLLYLEALYYNQLDVQTVMLGRINRFFLTLVGFKQFVQLPFMHVCDILESDLLGVNCELEVFYACVMYLNAQWNERKHRIYEMMRHVRFGLLPSHLLVSFRFKKESPLINRILADPLLEQRLSETIHYSLGLEDPSPNCVLFREREWIFDMECPFHSTKTIPALAELSYERFKEYCRGLAIAETQWFNYESVRTVEQALRVMRLK